MATKKLLGLDNIPVMIQKIKAWMSGAYVGIHKAAKIPDPVTDSSGKYKEDATVGSSSIPVYVNKGQVTPVASFHEALLSWGGKNFLGGYSPVDAAMVPELGACRTMFAKAAGIVVEYSTDGGETWQDYGASDASKVGLFSNGVSFYTGKNTTNGGGSVDNMLRVTLRTSAAGIYTSLHKFVIFLSTEGSTGCFCTIRCRLQKNYEDGVDTWVTKADKIPVSGWSGYNVINVPTFTTYGNTKSSQYGEIQFIFGCTGFSGNYRGLNVSKIFGFGGVGWTTPSTMAKTGHLYSYDSSMNATFPAAVTVTGRLKSAYLTGNNALTLETATNNDIMMRRNNTDANAVLLGSGYFSPYVSSNGKLDLGRSTSRWKKLWVQDIDISGTLKINSVTAGMLYSTGNIVSDGGLVIGQGAIMEGGADVTGNVTVTGEVYASAAGTFGSLTAGMKVLPFSGFVSNVTVQSSSPNISAGSLVTYYYDTAKNLFVAKYNNKYYVSWSHEHSAEYISPDAHTLFLYDGKYYKKDATGALAETTKPEKAMTANGDCEVNGNIKVNGYVKGASGGDVMMTGLYVEGGGITCEEDAFFESSVSVGGAVKPRSISYEVDGVAQKYSIKIQDTNNQSGGYQLLHQARANWNNTGDEAPLEIKFDGSAYTGLSMDSTGVYVCAGTSDGGHVAFGVGYKKNASADEDGELFGVMGNGNVMTVGSMTATAFNQSSDVRLKDIKGDAQLSVEDVAGAPMIAFAWNERARADKDSHVGTSAQYWHKVLPDVVGTDYRGYWTLDYATAGMLSAIATAREVVELKRELARMREVIDELKKMKS